MLELQSRISGVELSLSELEKKIEPLGFSMGGNWEYDHGYMDYQMDDDGQGYTFLRIPFSAVVGEIGSGHAEVVIGTPFFSHIVMSLVSSMMGLQLTVLCSTNSLHQKRKMLL